LQEYQTSLLTDPNRFNALLGAGRAAELLGKRALARSYYRVLLRNCADSSGGAPNRLEHARAIVQNPEADSHS
jgi:hypothetical protein